jgi:hypothetical protein
MAAKELQDLQKKELPAAFAELSKTHQSIPPIVKYCKEAYAQQEKVTKHLLFCTKIHLSRILTSNFLQYHNKRNKFMLQQ